MKCNQCKEEVDLSQWDFCPHCGGSLQDEKISSIVHNFLHNRRNVLALIILQIAILALVVFLVVRYQTSLSQKNQKIEELLGQEEVTVEWKAKERVLPLSYIADNRKLIELKVNSPIYGKLKIETEVEGITQKENKVIDIKPESRIYFIEPEITQEGYRKLSDSQKSNLIFKVDLIRDDGKEKNLVNERKEIFFYSRNDMIWQEDGVLNGNYVVRLINKDREEVKELVRKAADHIKQVGGKTNAMIGPLGGSEDLKEQLKAIFLAVSKDYQVRYVMAPYSYDSNAVQKIKTPEEVLRTKSGLCIELALLEAAALENVGLNPVVITTDSHAWVGVEEVSQSGKIWFIEMTMLDKSPNEAFRVGMANWNAIKDTPHYRLLRVAQLRAEGLLPIKY